LTYSNNFVILYWAIKLEEEWIVVERKEYALNDIVITTKEGVRLYTTGQVMDMIGIKVNSGRIPNIVAASLCDPQLTGAYFKIAGLSTTCFNDRAVEYIKSRVGQRGKHLGKRKK
jgi:hypothetical protein